MSSEPGLESVPVKLTAFALVLAAALGLGLAIGRTVGPLDPSTGEHRPTGSTSPTDTHDTHG